MISNDDLIGLVRRRLPDADVEVVDWTGTMDHFNVTVRSKLFAGKTTLQQHQLVYGALKEALGDGRVHAVQLTTITTEG